MKKIILLSSVVLFTAILVSSCTRRVDVNVNENYWLTQESGDVVYSDSYCGYFAVETNYGYTIIRSSNSSFRPYEGHIIYGNLGNYGVRDFYNYTTGRVIRGEVVEYDLSYADAQYALEYYCPSYRTNGGKIKESATSQNKVNRVVTATPSKE